MFEKYTEAARKVIFFARYEASQLGGEYIDTEHLLLGVFRSDPPLARRVLKDPQQVRSIREQVERQSSSTAQDFCQRRSSADADLEDCTDARGERG